MTLRPARTVRRLLQAFAGAAALAGSLACAATLNGRVVGIADGDTLTVLDARQRQHKIRLDGIDAPEKAQHFGMRSRQSLSAMVFGQVVEVETRKRDRYGRSVGKVIHEGRDVNLEQLRRGMAWHYTAYAHEQEPADRVAYGEAEAQARSDRIGLWSQSAPVAPWDWRKRKR